MPALQEEEPPLTLADLTHELRQAAKPAARWRIGIEHEKLAVFPDGRPVPCEGPGGMQALLGLLSAEGYAEVLDGGVRVGALGPRRLGDPGGQDKLSLEPGGQLEQSGPPCRSVCEARAGIEAHLQELARTSAPLAIQFISGGFRPFGTLDDVTWLPKPRYRVMREYLPTQGRLAAEMMKRTATVQMNFDFSDEDDATSRFRTAMAFSPVVTALSAASPISEGRPNGFKSYRAEIWKHTDEARCGVPSFSFTSRAVFSDYVEWALDVPMFFIVRCGGILPANGCSFRRFFSEGLYGHTATRADWQLHLSTLFPEVRLKHTLEVRGADAAPLPVAMGLAALCRGLLDEPGARAEAWRVLAQGDWQERMALRDVVPRAGLHAELGGRTLAELARELVALARAGLARLPFGDEDAALLDPIAELAERARCPADAMLEDFAATGGEPAKLIARWRLC